MRYYLVIKMNEILSSAAGWVELWVVMLSKINRTQKGKSIGSPSFVETSVNLLKWDGIVIHRQRLEVSRGRSSARVSKTTGEGRFFFWFFIKKKDLLYLFMCVCAHACYSSVWRS